tara:strand:+ start:550 stop:882 length:333 start_codon:yes stop_codon:yes gene_type:complete
MKTMKDYNGNTIEVYQDKDIKDISHYISAADRMWHKEWELQGEKDEGSCCLGKAIQLYYIPPRARNYKKKSIIQSPPTQGNISASQSVQPALDFLKSMGVEAFYYDGILD